METFWVDCLTFQKNHALFLNYTRYRKRHIVVEDRKVLNNFVRISQTNQSFKNALAISAFELNAHASTETVLT